MIVIKRNGSTQEFDRAKIADAVCAAFNEVDGKLDGSTKQIAYRISKDIEKIVDELGQLSVEEIQDIVESKLMSTKRKDVARAYVRYRYKKEILRDTNETYENILQLLEGENEELKYENSNKNSKIASTQRDYMAGEISKDLAKRIILPSDIVEAHKQGIIHFHDMDYFAQHIHNCCLVNLNDMLQNGTVINGTKIDKPHSFSTACNIATQIMACVASGQYGGQSITLSHIAPFVDMSRQKIKKDVTEELKGVKVDNKEKLIDKITEKRVNQEIEKGVQTIQYQINTLNTSNG